ncbi:MAG: NADH:ubiquinone oxidoreductase [Planctomycetes bacterium]|nr:NADH:ubiquinone oxidoreductase [Planctomycetota bacterium]
MKPRVAFFDFAGCEGDQLQIINLEEKLLDLLELVEIVSFREASTAHSDDYDIAFIEGSITREADAERLKEIRKNAKLVVAIGACATIGGINALKNLHSLDEVKRYVYGDDAKFFDTYATRPVDAVVKVDAYVHGCPIDRDEFLRVVKALLIGKKPELPNHPVCVECKAAENVCVFEKGQFCMGPVTRAGCNACCVTQGSICWGCRGFVDNPNTDAQKEILAKYGLDLRDVMRKFNLYTACSEIAK